jgi:RNA polymerase sigma factor (sigma-70 family)
LADQSEIVMDLLNSEGSRLLGLLKRLTLREDIAQDLLQELVIRLLESKKFFGATSKIAFARRCAMNLAFNWRRRARPKLPGLSLEGQADPKPSPHQQVADADEFQEILRASETLSELQRDIFILHFVEQESYESIASQYGKTAQQVRGLAHKAIEDIRLRLNRHEDSSQEQTHVRV